MVVKVPENWSGFARVVEHGDGDLPTSRVVNWAPPSGGDGCRAAVAASAVLGETRLNNMGLWGAIGSIEHRWERRPSLDQ